MRVLLVGGGATAAACARHMLNRVPHAAKYEIHLADAAPALGGRLETNALAADTGAQYLTKSHRADHTLYDELKADGTLVRLDPSNIRGSRAADAGDEHYVAPAGLASVVHAMLGSGGVSVLHSTRVARLDLDADSSRWVVRTADGERLPRMYDAVVLTPPVPETLSLLAAGPHTAARLQAAGIEPQLASVEYSRRFALVLGFRRDDTAAVEAAFGDHAIRYVSRDEDDRLVYVAHNSAKCGPASGNPPTIVAHSSVPYAVAPGRVPAAGTIGASAASRAEAELLESLRTLLPGLPEPSSTSLRTWYFSQVREPLESIPHQRGGCVVLPAAPRTAGDGGAPGSSAPALVLAGDAFGPGGSRFDSCVTSGADAALAVVQALSSPGSA